MAEDAAAPTRPLESVQNRSEAIGMERVWKRLRTPFCRQSRCWIRWGCSEEELGEATAPRIRRSRDRRSLHRERVNDP